MAPIHKTTAPMIVAINNGLDSLSPTKVAAPIPENIKLKNPITTIAIPKLDKFIVFYVLYEIALRFRGYGRGLG